MLKIKRKLFFWLFSALFFIALVYLGWVAIEFHNDYLNNPSHRLIGNSPSNVKALKENGLPFSFLVIGDTQSREKAESLIELALEEKGYSFMVIVGDFVKEPDIWNHRFFLSEMTTEIKPPFPVFLAAGNHDIDYGLKIKESERRVSPEVYESLYGARNFDFVFNQCLFVICNIDLRNPTSYLNYLRKTLSEKGNGKKYIFVFIHFPPKRVFKVIEPMLPDKEIGTLLPNEDDFFSLLDTYRVTTCFFGHHHGYWRGQRKGVNMIVSGGGGARLKKGSAWGKFHHILKVSVDPDGISEEMITLQEGFSIEDFIEESVVIHVLPIVANKGWLVYFLFILFLSCGILSTTMFFYFLFEKGKSKRSHVDGEKNS